MAITLTFDFWRAHEKLRLPMFKSALLAMNEELDHIKRVIKNSTLPDRQHKMRIGQIVPQYRINLTEIELAVLQLEDRRYFVHYGFELRSIPRLIRRFVRTRHLGGISTIEQQLVRTVRERRERTVSRKASEMFLAFVLLFHASKRSVLVTYLEICYLGYRIRGVDAASEFFFGRAARIINIEQAAFVASLLVYPAPKAVRIVCTERGLVPITDVEDFLSSEAISHFRWTAKIRKRKDYCINLLLKSK